MRASGHPAATRLRRVTGHLHNPNGRSRSDPSTAVMVEITVDKYDHSPEAVEPSPAARNHVSGSFYGVDEDGMPSIDVSSPPQQLPQTEAKQRERGASSYQTRSREDFSTGVEGDNSSPSVSPGPPQFFDNVVTCEARIVTHLPFRFTGRTVHIDEDLLRKYQELYRDYIESQEQFGELFSEMLRAFPHRQSHL